MSEMKTYKRLGTCSKCGSCCQCLKFQIEDSKPATEFYEARGFIVFRSKYDGLMYVMMNHKCPHLNESNECGMQKNKPLVCRLYPSHPSHHEGIACSYRWKEVEDDTNKTR